MTEIVLPGQLLPEMRGAYLALKAAAAAPYRRFIYDSDAQADGLHSTLFDAGAGEAAARFAVVATAGGALAGAMSCLTGLELQSARMRSTMIMRKCGMLAVDSPVVERIRVAGAALWRPDSTDFYLARLAVAPEFRGKGVGDRMLEHLRKLAENRRAHRILLEVEAENLGARRMYCGPASPRWQRRRRSSVNDD